MFFSWYASDTGNPITTTAYVPIPQEFGGGCIEEHDYKGDGVFGGQNIYELIVDWNKNALTNNNDKVWLKPKEDDYDCTEAGRQSFSNAWKAYRHKIKAWKSFKTQSEKQMKNIFGINYKLNLGIDIACYDDQNENLPFPIKITETPSVYEEVTFSKFCINGEML